jgi:glyoxylase-like metal-dependent hydrolase (beta-lactamase superfamily II)
MNMIFRQLFDPTSSTYTYLLGDGGEAVLIDPVYEQVPRDLALLQELGLKLVAVLDTHVHADHVTGAWRLQQRCGSKIALSAAAGASGVDTPLRHGDTVRFGSRTLGARATPGHTSGCLTFVLDDESMAFTGDSLLIRGCGRTDFQQGSPQQLFASVHEQILSLPPACLLYPAHDYRGITVTSVAEERRYNPRLGGDVDVGDFTGHMNNLNLPHPKLMAVAVPANLRSGQPEGDAPTDTPDVRGATLVPLSQLTERMGEFDKAQPIVAVCRSGVRSAQASVLLTKAGFGKVANLAGGMLRWKIEGFPVESDPA